MQESDARAGGRHPYQGIYANSVVQRQRRGGQDEPGGGHRAPAARLGPATLVMSVDPAHSLADSFDLGGDLFHGRTGDPYRITDNLDIQEVNIQVEIRRHWQEIAGLHHRRAADHRAQRRRGGRARHPARHGRAERHDVRQPVPPRGPLRRDGARLRADRREPALRQHADHARLVHEAHLSLSARLS